MDKIFRLTKVTKFSDGDENFVQRKILSDIVLSDKVVNQIWNNFCVISLKTYSIKTKTSKFCSEITYFFWFSFYSNLKATS